MTDILLTKKQRTKILSIINQEFDKYFTKAKQTMSPRTYLRTLEEIKSILEGERE